MASWIAKRPKHSGVREKFDPYIEIPHGQSGAGTNMRGSCKSCRQEINPTLARMAPHFLKKKGHVAVCTAKDLPEASVLAAKAYFDTVSLTNEGALTKRATDAAFSQQAIPSSLRGVSRRKHNTLLQSSCLGPAWRSMRASFAFSNTSSRQCRTTPDGLWVVVFVVVVLTLTRRIKSVVTGQAPVTLELRNTPGKKHKQTKGGTRISQLTQFMSPPETYNK